MATREHAASLATPNARALLLELYGGFVRRLGGWIAVADLVVLLRDLGVEEAASRAAASRMVRTGLLERARRASGASGYCLTRRAEAILEEGDRRIFQLRRSTELSDGWVLVVFSIPETRRDLRHTLRSRLVRLGFGNAAPGVWLAPRWQMEELRHWVERMQLQAYVDVFEAHYRDPDQLMRLIGRCWNLAEVHTLYAAFVQMQEPLLDKSVQSFGSQAAFVDYMRAQSQWRRLVYRDPGLPPEFLPPAWPGQRAAEVFFQLRERLDPFALDYVQTTVTRR